MSLYDLKDPGTDSNYCNDERDLEERADEQLDEQRREDFLHWCLTERLPQVECMRTSGGAIALADYGFFAPLVGASASLRADRAFVTDGAAMLGNAIETWGVPETLRLIANALDTYEHLRAVRAELQQQKEKIR